MFRNTLILQRGRWIVVGGLCLAVTLALAGCGDPEPSLEPGKTPLDSAKAYIASIEAGDTSKILALLSPKLRAELESLAGNDSDKLAQYFKSNLKEAEEKYGILLKGQGRALNVKENGSHATVDIALVHDGKCTKCEPGTQPQPDWAPAGSVVQISPQTLEKQPDGKWLFGISTSSSPGFDTRTPAELPSEEPSDISEIGGTPGMPTTTQVLATPTPLPVPFTIKIFGMSGRGPALAETSVGDVSPLSSRNIAPLVVTISSQQLGDDLVISDGAPSNVAGLPPGDYTLHVEYPPYKPSEQTFTLERSRNVIDKQVISVTLSMDPPDVETLLRVDGGNDGLMDYRTGALVVAGEILGYRTTPEFRFLATGHGPWGSPEGYVSAFPDGQPTGNLTFANGDELPNSANFSPDFKRILYVSNKDFWIAEIDWATNKLRNERQLTSVSLFNSAELYWDASGKYVVTSGQGYRVDLDTGNVDQMETKAVKVYPEMLSPDRKTIAINDSLSRKEVRFYDIASGQTVIVSMNGEKWGDQEIWLNADQFVVGSAKELRVINRNGTVEKMMQVNGIGIKNYSSRTVYAHKRDGDPLVSTKCVINNERQVINTETGKITDLPEGTADVVWVDDVRALISRAKTNTTTLDDRGTWLFNSDDDSLTPLHNLPFENANAIALPDKNVALFVANRTLYRVNLDGTGLEQLTTTGDFNLMLVGKLNRVDF
jgi:hypothetical protein